MKFLIPIFSLIIIFLLATNCVSAQIKLNAEEFAGQKQSDIWKTKTDSATDALLREMPKLDALQRGTLYAQLGDLWWEFDKVRSNAWFEKAVDSVVYYPIEDAKTNIERFYTATSQILRSISTRNQKQSDRLVKLLSEADSVSDKNSNPDVLIEFACLIVKSNPVRAYQIGVSAFNKAQPNNFHKLYWNLRRYSPGLADKFIELALSSAAASPNSQINSNLKTAVFPEISIPNAPVDIISSDQIKINILNYLGNYILQLQGKSSVDTTINCEAEAATVSSLNRFFSALLPQKEPLVSQAVSNCFAKQNGPRNLSAAGTEAIKKGTVEELLDLAKEAKEDTKLRSFYLLRAVSLANDLKQYKRALEILGGMTEEERKTDSDFWEELQVTVASGFAYDQFKNNDSPGAIKTLESVSLENRAFAKIGFVKKFSPENVGSQEFCISQIIEANRDIVRSEKSFDEKAGYWFQIVKTFADYKIYDSASETLKDIFVSANKSKPPVTFSIDRIKSILSPAFLENQEESIANAVNLIENGSSRTNAGLAQLSTAIGEYKRLRKIEADQEGTSTPRPREM
jgi:hypothetical protein